MNTWAKRGLQAAVVTGGMLALGAGVANADQAPKLPDLPKGLPDLPVKLPAAPAFVPGITIPVIAEGNAIGTPAGQFDLPPFAKTFSTDSLGIFTDPHGNTARAQFCIPIDISGNALALPGGNVATSSHTENSCHLPGDVKTSGKGSIFGGNVGAVDGAVPITVVGNAIGLGGNASTHSKSNNEALAGGDIETDGSHSIFGGNVAALAAAVPVSASGNAFGALRGNAESHTKTKQSATAGGDILTDGDGSIYGGNVLHKAVAVPVLFNGNAGSFLGSASAESKSKAEAKAGGDVHSSGVGSFAGGNVVGKSLSGPVAFNNNAAAALLGDSEATGHTFTDSTAGGRVETNGQHSLFGGNIHEKEAALPIEGFGNSAALLANAKAYGENKTRTTAGGKRLTHGDGSLGGGNIKDEAYAVPLEAFGNALGVGPGAAAYAEGQNDKVAKAGGYVGSSGNDAFGGGNVFHVPVAMPIQAMGNGKGVLGGLGDGKSTNHKKVSAGSDHGASTVDDNAIFSANILQAAAATPIEAFGNGGGLFGEGRGHAQSDTEAEAGGPNDSSGVKGFGSGNILGAAIARPTQAFGNGAAFSLPGLDRVGLGAAGFGDAEGKTSSQAGGDINTSGAGGAYSGNVGALPIAGAHQLFGNGASFFGEASGSAKNKTDSDAGGDVNTDGTDGFVAGNIKAIPINDVRQTFGNAGTIGGTASGFAKNRTNSESGGDLHSDGTGGYLSGNIKEVPVTIFKQFFGNAAGIHGEADAQAYNHTKVENGGSAETDGDHKKGSGFAKITPLDAAWQIFGNTVGDASTKYKNHTSIERAHEEITPKQITGHHKELPAPHMKELGGLPGLPGLPGHEMAAHELPKLGDGLPTPTSLSGMPSLAGLASLPDVGSGLPGLPGLDSLGGLSSLGSGLPELGGLPGLPGLDSLGGLSSLGSGLPEVGGLGGLPSLPDLPALPDLTSGLPGLDGLGGLTGGLGSLTGGLGSLTGGLGAVTNALGVVSGLPVLNTLGGLPSLPDAGALLGGLSALNSVPGLAGGLPDAAGLVPDASSVAGVAQAPGASDLLGLLEGLGVGLPGLPELPDLLALLADLGLPDALGTAQGLGLPVPAASDLPVKAADLPVSPPSVPAVPVAGDAVPGLSELDALGLLSTLLKASSLG